MKCEKCLGLLEPYFDGELDGPSASDVATHLEGCEACAHQLRILKDEQSLYLRYECDGAESPLFWEQVASKIRAEEASRRSAAAARASFPARIRGGLAQALSSLASPRVSPAVMAALLVVAVSLTALVTRYVATREDERRASSDHTANADAARRPEAQELPVAGAEPGRDDAAEAAVGSEAPALTAASENSHERTRRKAEKKLAGAERSKASRGILTAASSEQSPDRLLREAEQKYLTAITILSRDVGRRRTNMDPETAARFEKTLAVIDRAIVETRAAARRHPRDPEVVQYVLAAYAKKVDVLREMAQD